MAWLDDLLARWGYYRAEKAAQRKAPAVMLDIAGKDKSNLPDPSLYHNQAELFQRLSWVNIAVNTVANMTATSAINVMRVMVEKTKDIPNHPFELLLQRPNPLQSRFEFIKASVAYGLLTGNCYWYKNASSESAEPDELWIIPPYMINPIPDGRQFIKGYEYSYDGGSIMLDPWQIVHFKEFHPNKMFVGLSRVEPIAVTAASDLATTKWSAKLYGQNNARLPGILTFADDINDPDWLKIQEDLKAAAKDRQYLLLRGTGSGAVTWLQAAATLREMEYIEGRTFTKEEIFNVFAPGLASILAVNATEANARTGKGTLIEFGVWPMMVSMAEKITSDILPVYGGRLKAEFEDIRVTDRALELQEMDAYAKTHTIDEIREKYYEDEPLKSVTGVENDDRGILLPAQVAAGSAAPTDEEPEPQDQPIPAPDMFQPRQPPEQEGEETGENMGESAQEAEKKRWRRKAENAIKRGKSAGVEFVSDVIPADEYQRIAAALPACKSVTEIGRVFDTSKPPADVHALLEGIKLGVEALKIG